MRSQADTPASQDGVTNRLEIGRVGPIDTAGITESTRLTSFTRILYLVLQLRSQTRLYVSEFLVVDLTPFMQFTKIREQFVGRWTDVIRATAKPSHDVDPDYDQPQASGRPNNSLREGRGEKVLHQTPLGRRVERSL